MDIATWVIFFKEKALHGSLRPSGAGSRYFPRWSYRVELNENEFIENINIFNLSAQVHDPTMLHTTLVAELYRQAGFYVFDNFPVFVKINNEDKGLSQFIELVNEDFFSIKSNSRLWIVQGRLWIKILIWRKL